jgi:hypothetical protein
MISLDSSTCVTFRHILCNLSLHSCPLEVLQILIHLIGSWMNRIPWAMSLIHDLAVMLKSPLEPQGGPWTIELHRHLVESIGLLPTLIFGRYDPFQCSFFGRQWRLLWWLEWELCCSICHVEQLGDSVLRNHNMKSEAGGEMVASMIAA